MSTKQALDICRWLQVAVRERNLGGTALQVAHAIAHRINENAEAWPSLARLAYDTSLSTATVKRALNSLEDAGLISRTRRRRPDGGNDRTLYRILGFAGIRGGGSQRAKGGSSQRAGGVAHSEPNMKRDQTNGSLREKPAREPDKGWSFGGRAPEAKPFTLDGFQTMNAAARRIMLARAPHLVPRAAGGTAG